MEQARQQCWRYDWIVDLDIRGFFDNIPQDLLLQAVKKHAKGTVDGSLIERWLKAPVQEEDGQLVPREKGTPQGGVMTPRTQKITWVRPGSSDTRRGKLRSVRADYDPVCFDISARTKNNDCKIVKIDHEQILCHNRVKKVAELAPTFEQLMLDTIDTAIHNG